MVIQVVEREERQEEDRRVEEEPRQEEGQQGQAGQEEPMHSPPLTPGHDSNNDDPDLASLDIIVAWLRVKIAK